MVDLHPQELRFLLLHYPHFLLLLLDPHSLPLRLLRVRVLRAPKVLGVFLVLLVEVRPQRAHVLQLPLNEGSNMGMCPSQAHGTSARAQTPPIGPCARR